MNREAKKKLGEMLKVQMSMTFTQSYFDYEFVICSVTNITFLVNLNH